MNEEYDVEFIENTKKSINEKPYMDDFFGEGNFYMDCRLVGMSTDDIKTAWNNMERVTIDGKSYRKNSHKII